MPATRSCRLGALIFCLACGCAGAALAQDPDVPEASARGLDAPLTADVLIAAEAALRGRKYEDAVRIATAAIRGGLLPPQRLAQALRLRGAAYLNITRYAQAHADFKASLALEPRDLLGLVGRGAALIGLGRPADAFGDFNRALALRRAPVIYYWRGVARLQVRDLPGAVADFDGALALHPRYAPAYFGRGLAYHAAGQSARARDDYERALAIAPTLYGAREALQALRAGRPAPVMPPAPIAPARNGVVQF